jgi:uncharacterized protein YuzE
MVPRKQKMNYNYDRRADVLYARPGPARAARSREESEGIYIRYDLKTGELVGFTILDYRKRYHANLRVPHFPDVDLPEPDELEND